MIQQHVQPLMYWPYDAQLQAKRRRVESIVRRLANCVLATDDSCGSRPETGDGSGSGPESCRRPQLCPVPPVLHPSGPAGWWRRNRSSASTLFGPDGAAMVGHSLQLRVFEPGFPRRRVGFPVDRLASTSPMHARAFRLFGSFIGGSAFGPYDRYRNPAGAWSGIVARSSCDGELMLEVSYHHELSPEAEDDVHRELTEKFFPSVLHAGLNLASGYSQCSSDCFKLAEPRHLFGRDHLLQRLLDCRFKVRPHSFFQNNAAAAETLFSYLRRLLAADGAGASGGRPRLLLDAFCGTGVIGQLLAGLFDRIVGFDSSQSAVRDAVDNARLNGLASSTCEYHCEEATRFFARLPESDWSGGRFSTVCVLNPARDGLEDAAVSAIRACPAIERLVYISCRPEGRPTDNCLRLIMPEGRGRPFRLASCQPVDMFPNCRHVEVVLDFVR